MNSYTTLMGSGRCSVYHTHSWLMALGSIVLWGALLVPANAESPAKIDIQAPGKDGVSHNTFHEFNVDERGIILNNSHDGADTRLGGHIAGNPALAKGEASTIVNEVTGRDPSRLNGMMEVAGHRADVIVANPNGITCNGCGFINVDRGMLTTGRTLMENGRLKGFDVDKGTITIKEKGMNARGARYTDIVARAVQINGRINAKALTVVAGRNNVVLQKASGLGIKIKPENKKDKDTPKVSIDVAALGGMYANAISLIGTERGVGVNNAGNIGVSTGNLSISTTGRIQNSGTLTGNGVSLSNQRDIENKGNIVASNTLSLRTIGGIDNVGSIRGNKALSISTQNKLVNKGTLEARRSLSINTTDKVTNTRGQIDSGTALSVNAGTGVDNIYGRVHSGNAISINSGGPLTNICGGKKSCGVVSDGTLSVNASSVETKDAFIGAKGKQLYK